MSGFAIVIALLLAPVTVSAGAQQFIVNNVPLGVQRQVVQGSAHELAAALLRRWRLLAGTTDITRSSGAGVEVIGRRISRLRQTVTFTEQIRRARVGGGGKGSVEMLASVRGPSRPFAAMPQPPWPLPFGAHIVSVVEDPGAAQALTIIGYSSTSAAGLTRSFAAAAQRRAWAALQMKSSVPPEDRLSAWSKGHDIVTLRVRQSGLRSRFVLVRQTLAGNPGAAGWSAAQ